MRTKKNKLFITAFLALICFLSIGYFSCEKTGNPAYCDGILCQNGGSCLKGQCMCPAGFEDSACSKAIVTKYLGYWNVKQTVIGSDSSKDIGKDSFYTMQIKPTATPRTFFLYNFLGDFQYNQIVCTISGTNSYSFTIDSSTNAAMRFDGCRFLGGFGNLYAHDSIVGGFLFKYINPLHNWQVDTMKIVLTPRL